MCVVSGVVGPRRRPQRGSRGPAPRPHSRVGPADPVPMDVRTRRQLAAGGSSSSIGMSSPHLFRTRRRRGPGPASETSAKSGLGAQRRDQGAPERAPVGLERARSAATSKGPDERQRGRVTRERSDRSQGVGYADRRRSRRHPPLCPSAVSPHRSVSDDRVPAFRCLTRHVVCILWQRIRPRRVRIFGSGAYTLTLTCLVSAGCCVCGPTQWLTPCIRSSPGAPQGCAARRSRPGGASGFESACGLGPGRSERPLAGSLPSWELLPGMQQYRMPSLSRSSAAGRVLCCVRLQPRECSCCFVETSPHPCGSAAAGRSQPGPRAGPRYPYRCLGLSPVCQSWVTP